ncbi:CBS domain-containing protein [Alicyclobacillus tolerans]|uniref:CBS domain-containing protein n=1 Tax=Alicyclobacillus tolerans TaxID=90970 RepID=UPI001F2D58AE|nr:CBS domain-containing protein [Alicyclobacillus tolerans]MCF8568095.1 CBS domain-containing protein [Alicyclobacillus tolerans]
MKVRDFMIQDVISARPTMTIRDLLKVFIEHRVGGVPVIDEQNKLLGMVSDGDVIRYLAPRAEAVHDLFFTVYVEQEEKEAEVLSRKIDKTVESMMHRRQKLFTVNEDDEFEEAIRILSQHHFKKLPVLDGGHRVVGVISRGDIIHNLAKIITKK